MTRVALLIVWCIGACSWAQEAKNTFAYEETCPKDRLTVKPRDDLHPSQWMHFERPSADIAADPERLAMWRAEHDEDRERADADVEIYQVDGCGIARLYLCQRLNRGGLYCSSLHLPRRLL